MEENHPIWSDKEFKAYLLLYCAHADFVEKESEQELIKSKVSVATYQKIHDEFDGDSDFQKAEKINVYIQSHELSEEQINNLIQEIIGMFESDGEFSIEEQGILIGLKRFLGSF